MIERILAHTICWHGKEYTMHIAELNTLTGQVTLYPFTGELHSTTFISGTILLLDQ